VSNSTADMRAGCIRQLHLGLVINLKRKRRTTRAILVSLLIVSRQNTGRTINVIPARSPGDSTGDDPKRDDNE